MVDAEYHRAYYARTKERRLAQKSETRRRYREKVYAALKQYCEGHPCVDCEERDFVVLEFDHMRDKVMAISDMIRKYKPLEKIMLEVEKCEVRCANCHRRKTAAERGYYGVARSS